MSSALGQCRFPDGLVMYFEYSGTADVCVPALKDAADDIRRNWRSLEWPPECQCESSEIVELASDYGCGFRWPGKACRKCRRITDGIEPYPEFGYVPRIDGHPDWWIKQ